MTAADSPPSPVGRQLCAYRLDAPIGAGGMGEVYRAKDTRLGRDVALKILPAAFAADPQRRSRFEREARAVAALNHPNICTIHDVGHDQGIDFLVMELVDGESLAARLAQGPLPLDEALARAIEIADALAWLRCGQRDVQGGRRESVVEQRRTRALLSARCRDLGRTGRTGQYVSARRAPNTVQRGIPLTTRQSCHVGTYVGALHGDSERSAPSPGDIRT